MQKAKITRMDFFVFYEIDEILQNLWILHYFWCPQKFRSFLHFFSGLIRIFTVFENHLLKNVSYRTKNGYSVIGFLLVGYHMWSLLH